MENIQATNPLEIVHLDYLTIKATEGGKDIHVLVITDNFMWYAQALVSSSLSVKCTAQALLDKFIVQHGLTESTVSNQGQNVESDLITELHTSPCHLQTNGWCKHFNHTSINMLDTLPPKKKSSWGHLVPTLVHTYNCTRSTATGFSLTI